MLRTLVRSRAIAAATAAVGLGLAGAAIGLPWDIDMADSQGKKAYSHPMKGIEAGTIAQADVRTPVGYAANYDRMSPEGQALKAPFAATEASLATGKQMYNTYCTPCHGDGEKLGLVAQPGRFPGVLQLTGGSGVAKLRTDGYIYLTIRNGGAVMPYYGWAMDDAEMWSIVQYVRTLPGGAYVEPKPAEEEGSK